MNPPFGGKEGKEAQTPLRPGGRCGIEAKGREVAEAVAPRAPCQAGVVTVE